MEHDLNEVVVFFRTVFGRQTLHYTQCGLHDNIAKLNSASNFRLNVIFNICNIYIYIYIYIYNSFVYIVVILIVIYFQPLKRLQFKYNTALGKKKRAAPSVLHPHHHFLMMAIRCSAAIFEWPPHSVMRLRPPASESFRASFAA